MADPQSLIDAATSAGLSPELAAVIPRIIQIESGGNPTARTGSYTGVLQMGPQERQQYGGDDLSSGLSLLRDRAAQFEKQFGRPPSPTEFYLTHQQGLGGLSAHVANPDAPAWQNMAGTAEGRQKGAGWAQQAIWGNIPTQLRAQFPGGVGDVTSRQFMDLWRNKVEGAAPSPVPPQASPLGASAMGQAQVAPTPYFAPQSAGQSPQANSGAGLEQQGMAMLNPKLPQMPQMQLPPAWRPKIPPGINLATIRPFFPKG